MALGREARVLVVRADRLGDVVLSTPVLRAIHEAQPGWSLSLLIRPEIGALLNDFDGVREIISFDPQGRHRGLSGIFTLARELRERRFDAALVLQSQAIIDWAILASLIPVRVGPLSKPRSFFCYNYGVRQNRSRVEKHEAEYNLDLLSALGVKSQIPQRTEISISASAREASRLEWAKRGLDFSIPIIVIHPGMGKSAENWPLESYINLAISLLAQGKQVILSCGPGEEAIFHKFSEHIRSSISSEFHRYFFEHQGFDDPRLDRLAGFLSLADVVVAPSTGPLHVAFALGKRVVAFYPPIRVQSADRWGPFPRDDVRARILVPEVQCHEHFRCQGVACPDYPCMEKISLSEAKSAVDHHLDLVRS